LKFYFSIQFKIAITVSACIIQGLQGQSLEKLGHKIKRLENIPGYQEDTTYINTINEVAFELAFSNLDSMYILSERALDLSKNLSYKQGMLQARNNLGDHAMFIGDQEKAIDIHTQVISEAKKTKNHFIALRSLNSKAFILKQQLKYTEAYRCLNEGVEIAESSNNATFLHRMKMNLGVLFAYLDDFETSLHFFEECLELNDSKDSPMLEAEVMANIGYIHFEMGQWEKARENIDGAVSIFKKQQSPEWLAYCYQILASISLKQKEYDKANHHIAKSDSILTTIDDPLSMANQELIMADYMYLNGQLEKARDHLLSVISTSKELNDFDLRIDAEKLLSKIYAAMDNYKLALHHQNSFNATLDSVEMQNNKMRFAIERIKYQQELKEQEQLTLYQKQLATQRLIIVMTLVGLISLTSIIFLVRKNAKREKKVNESLRRINQTKDRVFSIIGHDLKEPIGTLQEMLNLYNSEEINEKEVAQMVPKLKSNVDQSSFSLNNLLYWARAQMNGLTTKPIPLPLKKNVEQALKSVAQKLSTKKIKSQNTINEEVFVEADAVHMDIILRNLISNAVKFTQTGGTIFLKTEQQNGHVKLMIKDTGIGIRPETIRAFHNGEIVSSSLGTHYEKGTGIGLYITRYLIELNNGSMHIDSKKGTGTAITVILTTAS